MRQFAQWYSDIGLLNFTKYNYEIFFIFSYLNMILIHNIDYSLSLIKQNKTYVFYTMQFEGAAAQDLWLAQRASQTLITGPECQQKYAGLEMKLQYIKNGPGIVAVKSINFVSSCFKFLP